jgi:heat shock protein HslJ
MRCGRITMGLVVSLFAALAWPTVGASADSPPLEGTAWSLTSLGGRMPPTEATATARFEGSRVQGTNGCNRYSAPVL